MRCLVVEGPRSLRIHDAPDPQPGAGEVCVRVSAAGVCGTDIHVYLGALGVFPRVPGHDVAGSVVALGAGVSRPGIGQRVTIDPAACCARSAEPVPPCPACARGATHLCDAATYMGISTEGAMAEYVVVPAARAVPLPDALDDDTATALEPVVVGLHLLEQIADRAGPVLVIGGGPIGIVAALLLTASGRDVVLAEPLAGRRAHAAALGVSHAVAPEAVVRSAGGEPFRVIAECSGHPSASDLLARHAAPGATLVLVGGATEIPARLILTRELEVRAAKGGRGLYPEAIALVAAGRLETGRLVTHRFPARDAAAVFERLAQPGPDVLRAVLDLDAW